MVYNKADKKRGCSVRREKRKHHESVDSEENNPDVQLKLSKTQISRSVKEEQVNTKDKIEDNANDIFSQILLAKKTVKFPPLSGVFGVHIHHPIDLTSGNLIHWHHRRSLGLAQPQRLKQCVFSPVYDVVRDLQLCRTASPFDRRGTSVEWHPTNPRLVAVGSKGGDILLWNIEDVNNDQFIQGIGCGGAIMGIKFHPTIQTKIYTSSVEGTVCLHDFTGRQSEVFVRETENWERWYCSLDTNLSRNQMAAGDTKGTLKLLTMDGHEILTEKLHKPNAKVTHTEYSRKDENLLITASMDRTVKVWDIRMLKDKTSALETLEHKNALSSAYFSPTDGSRLLTTDHHSEIRIYNTLTWSLERIIHHPHRHFQHLTSIKADWHPLCDLIVIGRYPDPKFHGFSKDEKRTIDMFDANTGELVCQLHDPSAPGIISLNRFCPQGDILASSMGVNILLWRRKEVVGMVQEKLMKSLLDSHSEGDPQSARSNQRQRGPSKEKKGKSKELKTKVQAKLKQENKKNR